LAPLLKNPDISPESYIRLGYVRISPDDIVKSMKNSSISGRGRTQFLFFRADSLQEDLPGTPLLPE
jgi:hypothetical protein